MSTCAVSSRPHARRLTPRALCRYQFKYAGLHGAVGTPSVFIGGVAAAFDTASWPAWEEALGAVIPAAALLRASAAHTAPRYAAVA
jgi:hypothetical protein